MSGTNNQTLDPVKISQNNIKSIGPINKKNDGVNVAKELLTREAAINGFLQIEKILPNPGQEFCVVAYFICDQVAKNGSHGMWFFIGTFASADQAREKATEIIEKTGIRTVYAMKTCSWQEINDKFQPDRTQLVPVDKRGKLRQQHEKEYQEMSEQYEREKEIRQEVEDELTKESDVDSLEYYIQQWFRIIKNTATIEKLESELDQIKKQLTESTANLKNAYQRNPGHEGNWIPQLEERLPKRGEEQLLEALKMGSKELRDDILK